MQEKVQPIAELILKYLRENISPTEKNELDRWVAEHPAHREMLEQVQQDMTLKEDLYYLSSLDTEKYWQQIVQRVTPVATMRATKSRVWKWMAAAVVLIGISLLTIYILDESKKDTPAASDDIAPGGNRAVLQLADGSVIVLDSAGNGVLRYENGVVVRKLSDGELAYESGAGSRESGVTYNKLSTPKGGQYQLRLPDGSKVWLNAASSIRYPVIFNNNGRTVEITGEAYFEVVEKKIPGTNDKVPFEVTILPSSGGAGGGRKVEVLGTHFNIMSYDNEPLVKATLLEGSIKVTGGTDSRIIQPGQQAQLEDNSITAVTRVNTDEVVAWKNGLFSFKETDVPTIMRQLERWYDVEVEYEGAVPSVRFNGDIPRNATASEVAEMLDFAGIHLRVEGKKLVVSQ